MRCLILPLCLVLAAPVAAQDMPLAAELDLSVAQVSRSGSAVNSSFFGPLSEVEDFNLTRLNTRIAVPTTAGSRLQLGLLLDDSDAATTVSGFDSDDTYRAARQLSLQFGLVDDNRYLGFFGASGDVRFNPDDADQDADFTAVGLAGQWQQGDFSLGGHVGVLDSSAENPETLGNATFVAGNVAYYFNDQARVAGRAAYVSGDQDLDSSSPDPVKLVALGLEIERGFAIGAGQHMASVYGTVDWVNLREGSSSGLTEEANDLVIGLGIRIAFGAGTRRANDHAFAPRLPQFTRWLGAVPVVD